MRIWNKNKKKIGKKTAKQQIENKINNFLAKIKLVWSDVN